MCTEQTSTRLANFARDCQHVLLNSQQLVIDETAVNKLVDQALKRHFTDRAQQKDDVIFTMTVRGCDELELDKNVQHPLVRVHLVDVTNGTAWTKKDADRPVLYHVRSSPAFTCIPFFIIIICFFYCYYYLFMVLNVTDGS
jgi:hypothetical protein